MLNPLPMTIWLCLLVSPAQLLVAQELEVANASIEIPAILKSFKGTERASQSRFAGLSGTQLSKQDDQLVIGAPSDNQISTADKSENTIEKFPETKAPKWSGSQTRSVSPKVVAWKSDNFTHRKLLFEERDLERHGIGFCTPTKQLLSSSKRFFGRSLALPISVLRGKQLQWECAPGK